MEITSHTLEKTAEIAGDALASLKEKAASVDNALVVGLVGDLGAGKTTFSQSVAQLLGVVEVVTSPTFVIEKVYHTKDTVFPQFIHIDAYRLDEASELEVLGFKDIISKKGTLVFVEWPERVKEVLPAETAYIHFKVIDEGVRAISYDFK